MKNRIINACWMALMMLIPLTGCDDNIDPIVEISPDRQFAPTELEPENGQTEVVITWKASLFAGEEGSTTYAIEVSEDLAFTDIEYSTTTTELQVSITNEDIEIKTDYYARIKANGIEGRPDSKWAVTGVFRITGEQIFEDVEEADLTNNSVNLKWIAGGEVTDIIITPDGGSPVSHTITAGEKTARAKLITGLTPGTTYEAEIVNGETSRGSVTFSTFSLEVPDADLIVYLGASDVFSQTTFDTLTASSVTFVFLQGSVYGSNTAMVLKGNTDITFYGEPGANKPVMSFNGLTLPAVGGKIKFENLTITGFEYAGGVETLTKRAYIFNQSLASTTSEVAFENCIIRNFENTPFRLQGANVITIGSLKVNKCIVYDISAGGQNYAFINNTGTNAEITNIEITKSTFYNVKIGLILHNTKPSQSVTVSECTVNDVSADTRALIDYNAQAVTTFTFAANILGQSKGVATARGIRIAGASVTVSSSSYTTTDYITVNNPIGGVTAYAGTSADLFNNPAAGDFSFKDTNFAGKNTSGDPRWRP